MGSRVVLFLLGAAFAVLSITGLALLRVAPSHASLSAALMAGCFAVALVWVAVQQPRTAGASCGACGALRDPALTFCSRCGRAQA